MNRTSPIDEIDYLLLFHLARGWTLTFAGSNISRLSSKGGRLEGPCPVSNHTNGKGHLFIAFLFAYTHTTKFICLSTVRQHCQPYDDKAGTHGIIH